MTITIFGFRAGDLVSPAPAESVGIVLVAIGLSAVNIFYSPAAIFS
jgi:hypothetical protein